MSKGTATIRLFMSVVLIVEAYFLTAESKLAETAFEYALMIALIVVALVTAFILVLSVIVLYFGKDNQMRPKNTKGAQVLPTSGQVRLANGITKNVNGLVWLHEYSQVVTHVSVQDYAVDDTMLLLTAWLSDGRIFTMPYPREDMPSLWAWLHRPNLYGTPITWLDEELVIEPGKKYYLFK